MSKRLARKSVGVCGRGLGGVEFHATDWPDALSAESFKSLGLLAIVVQQGHRIDEGDHMGICVPIRDMKDTAKFSALVEAADEPVTVTKNGYGKFVVMPIESYDLLLDEVARAKLLAIVARGEKDYAAGEYVGGASFTQDLREKYGL